LAVGRDLNLDTSAFSECVNGGDNARRAIDRDSRIAESLGIQGTPAFAVGSITSDARVSVSTVIDGAQPFTVFEETITDLESTTGHVEH
jgi:predicted DsbA family dithiol-disulfide isomerase